MVVLASELLREAEKLVMAKLHPQTIIAGYRKATDICRQVAIVIFYVLVGIMFIHAFASRDYYNYFLCNPCFCSITDKP